MRPPPPSATALSALDQAALSRPPPLSPVGWCWADADLEAAIASRPPSRGVPGSGGTGATGAGGRRSAGGTTGGGAGLPFST
jgi:hypothetical protein